jgi:uncharacterized protein
MIRLFYNYLKGISMKKKFSANFILPIFLMVILSGFGFSQNSIYEDISRDFLKFLNNGEYIKSYSMFDDNVKKQLSESKLQEIWESILSQYGKYESIKKFTSSEKQNYHIVVADVLLEESVISLQFAYNQANELSGFVITSVQVREDKNPYIMPNYADENKFTEREIKFGQKEWELNGILTLPKAKGKFPVVILIHGSGPNDKDESIGPNKPFKDLASGLASRGIAVLRYDKRTKTYGAKIVGLRNFTVQEESIDDALEAVKFLQNEKEMDKSKIYILGHSLGGYLMPRIAKQAKDAAGFIVLAGSTRPMEDLIIIQTEYILKTDGVLSEEDNKTIAKLEIETQKIKNLKQADTNTSMLFNAPVSYWLDLKNYQPEKEITSIKKRMIFMQGGRDYQVTTIDFDGWKKALINRKDVTFKLYDNLNHLFISGTGKSTPEEYQTQGHVDEKVIEDISTWILTNNKTK